MPLTVLFLEMLVAVSIIVLLGVYKGEQSKVDYYQNLLQPLLKPGRDGMSFVFII